MYFGSLNMNPITKMLHHNKIFCNFLLVKYRKYIEETDEKYTSSGSPAKNYKKNLF